MGQQMQQMQQWPMGGFMPANLPSSNIAAQVNAAWEGEEDQEQDCQLQEDGGWGPSTIPAFAAGGPKFKGKGRGKFMQMPAKGAVKGQAGASY